MPPRYLRRHDRRTTVPPPGRHPADDLLGDVGAGGAHRRGQPRPGLPRRRRAAVRHRAAVDGARGTAPTSTPPASASRALRAAIARHQQRHYGLELDPDREVVVTTGCTEAIAAALLGLVDPGDEVVVLEPYYDSYVAMLDMCGAVRRPVTLRAPDFRLDVDELRAAVTDAPGLILLNTPHNPTGTVLTRDELAGRRRRRDRARPGRDHRRGLRAPRLRRASEHVPLATLPGMWERTLTLSSAGKSLLLHRLEGRLGHRPGAAGRRGARRQAVADLHLRLTAAAGRRARARPRARLAAGRWPATCRRAATCSARAWPTPAWRRACPEGTYFATTDIATSAGPTGGRSASRCPSAPASSRSPRRCSTTTPEAGRHLVRWAFCKEPDVIGEGVRRLAGADLCADPAEAQRPG